MVRYTAELGGIGGWEASAVAGATETTWTGHSPAIQHGEVYSTSAAAGAAGTLGTGNSPVPLTSACSTCQREKV